MHFFWKANIQLYALQDLPFSWIYTILPKVLVYTKSIHQTPMTCTYGYSHFRHFQNCCNRDWNAIFKYMNYVFNFVATVLEVHFSVLKKGTSHLVCTSHWCLVMSFWLKVCIYGHTRGVKLGLGLGFMQTSQVLPHWLNQSFSFEPCLIHRGIVMLE